MAFQAGSRVDPRLLDYSGYAQGMTQAAAINAQALASLGQAVGEGITKYNEKQIQKQQKKDAIPVVASFLRQIDPGLSEEQSNAGATSFINYVGIDGVQAAIPVLTVEAMKSSTQLRKAQIDNLNKLFEQDTLSITDQQKALEGFQKGGGYANQGVVVEGGQLYQVIPTKGDFNPFTADEEKVLITEGPIYDIAVQSGALAQTPEIDTSMVGQPPVGTGTVLKESNATGSSTAIPNDLNLDIPLEEAPTSEQFTDITSQVDYGEFDVPKPVIKKQEGYRDLTPVDRPKTYKEFKESQRKRSDATPEKYQKYLDNFEYKYPMTFEEYNAPNTGLINYEPGKGLSLDFSDRGRFGGSEERYINEYLPRFY